MPTQDEVKRLDQTIAEHNKKGGERQTPRIPTPYPGGMGGAELKDLRPWAKSAPKTGLKPDGTT